MTENRLNNSFLEWIVNHDESRVFVILYIGLAVFLSIALGLFWLCVVVAVHLLFEVIRQWSISGISLKVLAFAVWEIKLDIFLIFFAFVITVYMDIILGAAGLSAGARAAASAGSRFALWQKMIRSLLLSIDDLAQIFKAAGKHIFSDKKKNSCDAINESGFGISDDNKISAGDVLSLSFGIICIISLASAPLFTDYTYTDILKIIIIELKP